MWKPGDDLVNGHFRRAIRSSDEATVHIKAGHLRKHLAGYLIDRYVDLTQRLKQPAELGFEPDDAAHREAGLYEARDDEGSLGDDEPLASGEVGAGVRVVEIPVIVQARIGRVIDANHSGHVLQPTREPRS